MGRHEAVAKNGSNGAANGSIGVLICDDVKGIRELLGAIVELHPGLHLAGHAADGLQAISEAARLKPDVILLDLSMPRRTGLEALPDIKRVAPNAKVIILSGFAESTLGEDVFAHGADRYLEKGAHPDTITATILEVAGAFEPGAKLK